MLPSGMPLNNAATNAGSTRFGTYSAASATIFGSAPPIPRPVRKRKIRNSRYVVARAVSNVNTPKHSAEPMTGHLCPQRSAMVPWSAQRSSNRIHRQRTAGRTFDWESSHFLRSRAPDIRAPCHRSRPEETHAAQPYGQNLKAGHRPLVDDLADGLWVRSAAHDRVTLPRLSPS